MRPDHLLVESQDVRLPDAGSHFLRMAHRLAQAGARTVVLLIDDGVGCATGDRPAVAPLLAAGGVVVWADEVSLSQRALPADALASGVTAVSLDKVAPLLFDPDVKVVWH